MRDFHGLKGIRVERDSIYIRPLISIEREEIEEYCKQNNLNPRYDKTNKENIYMRNKIRNVLIPFLEKEFNPNIIDTIDRMSDLIAIENDYIEEETSKAFDELLIKKGRKQIILNLKEFNKRHKCIKARVIIYTIKKLLGDVNGISKVHIEDIIKLCENNIGNKYLTPNKHLKVMVNKGKMYFFVTEKT